MVSRKGRLSRNRKHSHGDADCSCLILAGGLSSRFGVEKASYKWHGQSLIARVAEQVRYVAGDVFAVARAEQDTGDWPVDAVIHDDGSAPAGPLRGIAAGLRACNTRFAYVLSCDAPFVQRDLLARLRHAIGPRGLAAVPYWEDRLQPLVALYRTSVAAFFEQQLRQGQQSPTRALENLAYVRVDGETCRRSDPDGLSFINVNTPGDLARLERKNGLMAGHSN